MTNLLAGIIGAVLGAGVGIIGLALCAAAKTEEMPEEPQRECVMEEKQDFLYVVYHCSACGEDIVDDTESEELGWKFCPECGAKIVAVKKMEEEDDDL